MCMSWCSFRTGICKVCRISVSISATDARGSVVGSSTGIGSSCQRGQDIIVFAMAAESAAQQEDSRASYAIVTSLAGRSMQHNPMVKRLDGSLTESPDEADER